MHGKFNLLHPGLMVLVLALMLGTSLSTAFAGDEANMAAKVAEWQQAYNAGNLDAVSALYGEDGCRMPPNLETANGRAAIKAQLEASYAAAPQVKLGLTHSETNGNLGFAIGTYAIMNVDGAQLDQGKWMNVSRRGADGSWIIHCDIWNSSEPMPAQGTGE